ncbi:glycosyl transferase family 90 protein [Nitzschia inconspicua]|uniref:Glycosyl transferase family 90 protein n=1 Tax=Nitzschia inconspicua TaxID=303405 RepID=A0A9K3M6C6_9STRA|nr:glycosyl transferase family 90 protein [Nitzschia inconspicua]
MGKLKVNDHPPEFRGIFGEHGDSEEWLKATAKFPNRVPRFESKDDCLQFMRQYVKNHGGSNPDFEHLQHIFTTLITWEQIERILLPAMEKARREPSKSAKIPQSYGRQPDDKTNNVYERSEAKDAVDAINFRLDQPFHQCTTPCSVTNTLKYLFFHMKCGIYVMIHDGKLRIFCPFANRDYSNTWSDKLKLEGDGSLEDYYSRKEGICRKENIVPDMSVWWANGNIICNEITQNVKETKYDIQVWGDQFLCPLRDMLEEACRQRQIPDCEFFLNKRDYPQLKVNVERGVPVEPYGFIFDKDDRDPAQDIDLVDEHKFKTYAPIVSFYAAAEDRFTDIPWPSSEDWEGACGLVFPQTFICSELDEEGYPLFKNPRDLFTEANFRKFERGWDDGRVATAFFRGTATGGGTTIENNQRLKVAHLSHIWKDDPEKGGDEPFLNAAIVGWNLRDKKVAEGPMTFLRPGNFEFTAGKHHFTPIYEQSMYKYLVYVDGHCAACRYGFMMRLGSVILKVAPRQVADRMWYFPLLQPYVDHVPVKADLSDLEEKIRWCRQNDEKCREIAANCMKFYEKYVARSGLLDYVEMVTKHIARRQIDAPKWWSPPPPEQPPPQLNKPDGLCYEDRNDKRKSRLCARCQDEAEAEQRELEANEAKAVEEKKNVTEKKKQLRLRMRKRAKAS